ncbi:MAG: DUF1476 domain-containing protein [Rhodospirillales bacterium]
MVLDKKSAAHEKGHAIEHEVSFKVEARRNKLLGLWIAENFGYTGKAAEDYAVEVIHSDMEEPGIEDVLRKIMNDIAANNVNISEDRIREKIDEFEKIARGQIEAERP